MRFKDNRSRTGRYVPAFVFLIFIFGMAVWFLINPKSDYSSSEKRYLQQFPEVTVDPGRKNIGMDITIVTTATDDKSGRELLKLLGMPFRKSAAEQAAK